MGGQDPPVRDYRGGHHDGATGLHPAAKDDKAHFEHIPMREFVSNEQQYDVPSDPRPVGGVRRKGGKPDLPPKKSDSVVHPVKQTEISRGMRVMFGSDVKVKEPCSGEDKLSDDVRDILDPPSTVNEEPPSGSQVLLRRKVDRDALHAPDKYIDSDGIVRAIMMTPAFREALAGMNRAHPEGIIFMVIHMSI